MCIFFCLDCTELVNEIVCLYYGGATGTAQTICAKSSVSTSKKATSGPRVFCLSFENLVAVGRREDCDISPPAACSCGRSKGRSKTAYALTLGLPMTLTRGLSKEKGHVHPCSSSPGFPARSWKSAPGHMTVRRSWTRPQIQPRKCVFSRSGVRVLMSPRDVLMMFSTCFEGTFSLRKASVIVIPMASFIVSSFGDVHKRCMKVLPLSLVFFFLGSLVSA